MVAEDEDVGDLGGGDAGFFGEHGLGAVLVEADHGGEAVGREAAGLAGSDHAVGICRIANHGDAGVFGGDFIDDLGLGGEDFAIVLEQVGALHAGSARLGTDEEAPVRVAEAVFGIVGEHHALEEWESAVVEFHRHAFEGFHGFFHGNLEELENHGLVGSEHGPGGDAGEEGVGNLTGGSSHGYTNGRFHKIPS